MRRWSFLAILPALSILFQAAEAPGAWHRVGIQSIELSDLTTDRIRLQIHLTGTADRDLTIRTLSIEDVWLNGIPMFLAPVVGPIRVEKGQPFDQLATLQATVFFRDLESLDPVRRMIRDEKASLRATIRLQPELNLFQQIALRSSNVWASAPLERNVTVKLPAGILGKNTLLLGLAAAEPVWVLGRIGMDWRSERDSFLQKVRTIYAPRVLSIETSYEIRARDGRKTTLHWQGLGFRVYKGRVLVPAEAVEPWMFEGALAEAISSKAAEVVKESLHIIARETFNGPVRSHSLQAGELKILSVAADRGKAISIDRKKTYSMRRRDSANNVAWLEAMAFQAREDNRISTSQLPSQVAPSVAIFRLRSETIEVLLLPTVEEQGRIRLAEPLDSRAFGSPVIGPNGFLGMLQDQTRVDTGAIEHPQ